jgi:hypothetical protein
VTDRSIAGDGSRRRHRNVRPPGWWPAVSWNRRSIEETMTAAIVDTQPERRLIGDDAGPRCTLCDRVFPGQPDPIKHRFVLATRPNIICDCDADHRAATWHSFVVVNQRGGIVAGGMVCPSCAVDPGLGAALDVAARRVHAVVHGTN